MKWTSIHKKLPSEDKIIFLKNDENLIYLIFSDELHTWKKTGKNPLASLGIKSTFDMSQKWYWKEAH